MLDDANPYAEPQPRPPERKGFGRMPRLALAGGVAVGLAIGGAGLAFAASGGSPSSPAASNTGSSTTTTVPKNAHPPLGGGPFRGGRPGFGPLGLGLGGPGGIVHGVITEHSGSGYKTIVYASGQVNNGSTNTSIIVKSPDGFTTTYSVIPATVVNSQAGGISSVTAGDQVTVTGTSASNTGANPTAVNIVDTTKLKQSRSQFGFGPPPGQEKPSTSSTTQAKTAAA
jgi:hypothetical protein